VPPRWQTRFPPRHRLLPALSGKLRISFWQGNRGSNRRGGVHPHGAKLRMSIPVLWLPVTRRLRIKTQISGFLALEYDGSGNGVSCCLLRQNTDMRDCGTHSSVFFRSFRGTVSGSAMMGR
jgi:hypothetical protein